MPALFSAAGWIGVAALLGLVVGSFINLLVRRLPLMLERQWQQQACDTLGLDAPPPLRLGLWLPRSHCPHCLHTLAWWENLPLLGFAVLRGRCHACGARIGWRYPLVEAGTSLLSALLIWHGCSAAQLPLLWGLLALALIDFDCGLLPDTLTLPLLWLGLLLAASGYAGPALRDAVFGASAGYLCLSAINAAYRAVRGVDGIGGGDSKLFAALGAWFGWAALPTLLLLAASAGAAVGLLQLASGRRSRDQELAFGPYLAAAALLLLLWPRLGHLDGL